MPTAVSPPDAPRPRWSPLQAHGLAGAELLVEEDVGRLAELGWDAIEGASPFLRSSWLDSLARAGAPATRYLLWRESATHRPLGVALAQRLAVAEMRLGRVPPRLVAGVLGSELRVFGQVLFSGLHGLHFARPADGGALLTAARRCLENELSPGPWLAKDLPTHATAPADWTPIDALPDLVLDLAPTWANFGDYLAALPSKYRRRVRRARRLFAAGLERRHLEAADLETYAANVDGLYDELLARAPYVPFRMPPGYLARLAAAAGERCRVTGYFDAGRMVGFSSLLLGGDEALAHLAAVEPAYNGPHQLYLNLLLDLLEASLDAGARRLHYGRTATTIKTSVGAQPRSYASFATHDGPLRARLLGLLNTAVLARGDASAALRRPFG